MEDIEMASDWIAYNELAWTEDYLADPSEYKDEVSGYIDLINSTAEGHVETLLHLGCGAGGHDMHFKDVYSVTGVDISRGMLDKARSLNPEIEYIEGDMRTVKLNRRFDCVAIPDSIDYMASLDDLKLAVQTSAEHLKPGGVLLIVCKTRETFRNNNFVYAGEKGDINITLFENNYINPYVNDTYEITLVYLIRQKGKLTKYSEETTAGLFSLATWEKVLRDAGFEMRKRDLDGLYDSFLSGEGEYPMTVFIGTKR